MNRQKAGRHSARFARSADGDIGGYPALRAKRREGRAAAGECDGMNASPLALEINGIPVPLAAPAIGGVHDAAAARIDLDECFWARLGLFGSRQGRKRLERDAKFAAPEGTHSREDRGDVGRQGEAKDDREHLGHGESSALIFAGRWVKAIRLGACLPVRRFAAGQSSSSPDSGGMGRLAGGLPKAARSQSATSGPSVTSTKTMMISAIFILVAAVSAAAAVPATTVTAVTAAAGIHCTGGVVSRVMRFDGGEIGVEIITPTTRAAVGTARPFEVVGVTPPLGFNAKNDQGNRAENDGDEEDDFESGNHSRARKEFSRRPHVACKANHQFDLYI